MTDYVCIIKLHDSRSRAREKDIWAIMSADVGAKRLNHTAWAIKSDDTAKQVSDDLKKQLKLRAVDDVIAIPVDMKNAALGNAIYVGLEGLGRREGER